MVIRVTWKDSYAPTRKTRTYRGYTVSRYRDGWQTDLPNDRNIYSSADSAQNAIDEILGDDGRTRKPNKRRANIGVKIIGRKDDAG